MSRKLRQVTREVERACEAEYDENNVGKTEKDKDDERKLKAGLSSFKETQPFYVLDSDDTTEFWRYLYEYTKSERKYDGLLSFLERFYRDYTVQEL